jgi:predicted permease
MQGLIRDFHFGARVLSKNVGFALAAVSTLALGIGANTCIFAIVSAVLLRPFAYREPQQLLSIQVKDETADRSISLLRYELVRDQSRLLQSVAAWANDDVNLTGHGEPVQLTVTRVSPNFFSVLGVQSQLGRTFSAKEGRPEGQHVVVISDSFWRSRFGGNHNVIGETLRLDATPHTIVGVLPPGVHFPFVGQTDIWTPRYFEYSLIAPQKLRLGASYLSIVARLRPGKTLSSEDAELAALNQQYRAQNPAAPDAGGTTVMSAEPLRDLVVAGVREKLVMLSVAVALVLLIACANVASLLLSRALARRREVAIRLALGATRQVIAVQLLSESMLLALAGGVLGMALSWIGIRAISTIVASQLPEGMPIEIDLRVMLFTLFSSLLAGIFFGTFPAFQASRFNIETSLREESRGVSAGRSRTEMKSVLVVGQVALSLVLLIGAGLLLRSFERMLRIEPGFDAHNVLTMNVSLPTIKYGQPEQQTAFFNEMLRRVSALPGVDSAAISAALPLSWKRITPVLPEGQLPLPLAQRPFVDIEAISPNWFRTMHVARRGGRAFTAADDSNAPKVVIVNKTFARRFWPGQNPLGKHIIVGRWPDPAEVIGIVADVKNQGLGQDTQAQLYLSFPQLPWADMNLLVRTTEPPRTLISAVRAQISAIDPEQPVANVQTIDELVDTSLEQPRFMLLLLGIFSSAALLLSVIGIYGVLSYWVALRRFELGVRLALGSQPADLRWLVVRQGLVLALLGTGIGLIAALCSAKLMSGMLYNVSPLDPATFTVAPLSFLCVALVASYLPARTAARVDPSEALRAN